MRIGGPGVRSESTRDAGGELLFVSRAGGAAAAVFPIGRKTFSRAALAGFGFADCFNGACEFVGAIKLLWNTTWHAVVVWALLAPFAIGLIYLVLLPIFRRVVKGQTAVPPAAEASAA